MLSFYVSIGFMFKNSPTTKNVVVQEVVNFEIGCFAVYVTLNFPFLRIIFSLLIHDGLTVTSRLMFKSVLGLWILTSTSLLYGGSSTIVFCGHINFGVGYSWINYVKLIFMKAKTFLLFFTHLYKYRRHHRAIRHLHHKFWQMSPRPGNF